MISLVPHTMNLHYNRDNATGAAASMFITALTSVHSTVFGTPGIFDDKDGLYPPMRKVKLPSGGRKGYVLYESVNLHEG